MNLRLWVMSQQVLVSGDSARRTGVSSALDSGNAACHSVSVAAARIKRRYYSPYYAWPRR